MIPKVFVTKKIPENGLKLLKKHFNVKVWSKNKAIPKKDLIKNVKNADALLCLLTDKIDKEVIKANPNLKAISNYAVGFDNIDIEAATKYKIPVANTAGVLSHAVAEHTIGLMLAVAKRIVESDKFTRAGKYKGWEPMMFLGHCLRGKTLGIVGYGRIGSITAEIAHKGLKMNVIYYSRNRKKDLERDHKSVFVSLNELMKKSDVISLHVPLTKETKHLINSKRLSMMKKTAYLINTSRGPVLDEKALFHILKNKKIAGAAIDVFEHEPNITKGLKNLNNIVMTPHIASAALEAREKMSEVAAQNIIDILKGRKTKNLVNKEVLK